MKNNMRNDFCAFILTHGRADRVHTYKSLREHGYTGKIFIVIDNEDVTADDYYKLYKDEVIMFDKKAIAKTFDEGDNFNDRRAIIYARNACFEIARKQGYKYFIQLDDDYTGYSWRLDGDDNFTTIKVKNLDRIFMQLVDFHSKTNFLTVALAQPGDLVGGIQGDIGSMRVKRKAMNSFICDVDRPFTFFGRINEDVNLYTCAQRRGEAVLTFLHATVNQKATQSNAGGMTDLYIDSGTYIKSFYTVMYAPSCTKVHIMHTGKTGRLHHRVAWNNAAPKIISDKYKKQGSGDKINIVDKSAV
tara:strand:+ start:323 stop:1228 length:906 start_codon:yes stop_codon:yes gene_type:complete